MEYFPFYAIIILQFENENIKLVVLYVQTHCNGRTSARYLHLRTGLETWSDKPKSSFKGWTALFKYMLIQCESCLLYLTMRHAATLVHSAPVRSSGCEKGWQGLKVRRISALTGMSSADTGFKRPRKPSASPIVFRFITPLPSFMMHLQLLTLKQPAFLVELGWGEWDEENVVKQAESMRKTVWGCIVTVCTRVLLGN